MIKRKIMMVPWMVKRLLYAAPDTITSSSGVHKLEADEHRHRATDDEEQKGADPVLHADDFVIDAPAQVLDSRPVAERLQLA